MPHKCDHYDRINYPLQAQAFDIAHEIMDGRDGAGFMFEVYTTGGHVFAGPTPGSETIGIRKNGVLAIEHGDKLVLIHNADIAAIAVVEC